MPVPVEDIKTQLLALRRDLDDGLLTKKGFGAKSWKILQPHVPCSLKSKLQALNSKLETLDLPEEDYHEQVVGLLEDAGSSHDCDDGSGAEEVEARVSAPRTEGSAGGDVPGPSAGPAEPEEPSCSGATETKERKTSGQKTMDMFLKLQARNGVEKREEEKATAAAVQDPKQENGDARPPQKKRRKLAAGEPEEGGTAGGEGEEEEEGGAKPRPSHHPRCHACRQLLEGPELRVYQGHPNDAVEEYVALTDPRLSLFTGDEETVHEYDAHPQNKITWFSVYDKEGHLCPFDNNLIEKNVLLYFSGYVKAIYEESPGVEGGIPTKDLGPINEWWVSGYDGGERAIVGFATGYGEYVLMEPSDEYAPFMAAVQEKIFVSKVVIEVLSDDISTTYEDLLQRLEMFVPPAGVATLTEETLLRHAQFVCSQVNSFDGSAGDEDDLLIASPCMRTLLKLSGAAPSKRLALRRMVVKDCKLQKSARWMKATTTPLVQNVFESFFRDQLDKESKEDTGPRRKRCGVCETCQQPDCGACSACKDMLKFGGSGKSKQACVKRRCPNMAIEAADESEPEDDVDDLAAPGGEAPEEAADSKPAREIRDTKRKVEWLGEPVVAETARKYYSAALVGELEVRRDDCVLVESKVANAPLFVAHVMYMYQNMFGEKKFHCRWFSRGTDTVLGETADPAELFWLDECEDCSLSVISRTAVVEYRPVPERWAAQGGEAAVPETERVDDGRTFFCKKRYDSVQARFLDLHSSMQCADEKRKHRYCNACDYLHHQKYAHLIPNLEERLETPGPNGEVHYGLIRWKKMKFRPGSCVYVLPGVFRLKNNVNSAKRPAQDDKKQVDEDMYPEVYRKSSDRIKGSNVDTPEPFCIGYISTMYTLSDESLVPVQKVYLKVNKMYRPENTCKGASFCQQADLNLLFWSDEEMVVSLDKVVGRCHLVYLDNLSLPVGEWSQKGPDRFYFSEAYNAAKKSFQEPPPRATNIGLTLESKGKGKGKGKGKLREKERKVDIEVPDWPIPKKLRCLDVFAGCGGLSEGLHQSGVAETLWAIEKEEPAAHAFRLNNPGCEVFTDDCNVLLKLVMAGETSNERGQKLPQKGQVELLCGGPPCQGFSGMNRFNSRQYSLFKNSLIVSYLSYCDYYRPRFFILENVRNFVSFKRSMVLKLTLRCLVKMGYQCTFGVLQAGSYGVPQTRRRAIILAAAPGEQLPNYPEPLHVFSPRACQLTVMVDDKKYVTNCKWVSNAPLRTITVRDAMSDLPEIRNGHRKEEMLYGGDPLAHFQRKLRGPQEQPVLRDHICKEMAPLVEARMAHVPTASGSDWRDLPNAVVRLSDGSLTSKLMYTYHDKKNGRSRTGALRGVCACAAGRACNPADKQNSTLIPWCLPHTGNRHNHWAGLYGRLEWDGFFSTTVTNPEPMGKQGRVLHPEQTRVVSVRECARSQGFPDAYRFFGSVLDKHRQIGNAVPPPMGAAIGYEILKCVSAVEEEEK
ncbi:DNA (cytosine-5)-methyltransferase PliMCI-like [Bacillus rossius redtenbacheri]|uniref:DNA (cytosine-5)-methyltransferase PliMCI-like n=1 Tax=Bacillus rossius redtenbacheri TaxID=93214 RepID=UPI002FDDE4CC